MGKKILSKENQVYRQVFLILYMPLLFISTIGLLYYLWSKSKLSTLQDDQMICYVTRILGYSTVWSYSGFSTIFRSSNLWDWIVLGYGACGEVAEIGKALLNYGGLNAFVAGFPAEDHFFTVVNLNGTWYAIDPGYYDHVITLRERVERRVIELGNVSYIVVYLNGGGFLELTHHYVPYDTIVIKVTYYGVPVVGARISLAHRFQGSSLSIPGGNHYFYTDANGTVVLHLGSPRYYRDKVGSYDPYF